MFGEVERWLSPYGYKPAVPTFNFSTPNPTDIFGDDRPALWSGDRDSFAFFYTEPDPNGADFGGLRRGIYVGNSEVGASALKWSTFLFRDMCANFLVWGTAQVKKRRVKHVGDTFRVFHVYCRELQRLATEVEPLPLKLFRAAAAASFAGDGSPTDANREEAVERLQRQFGAAKHTASAAVDASLLPQNATPSSAGPALSFWSIAQGLTWEAKQQPYASAIVDTGELAEAVLQEAGR